MKILCGVIIFAYAVVIIWTIIKSKKDKKELKEMDERLKP